MRRKTSSVSYCSMVHQLEPAAKCLWMPSLLSAVVSESVTFQYKDKFVAELLCIEDATLNMKAADWIVPENLKAELTLVFAGLKADASFSLLRGGEELGAHPEVLETLGDPICLVIKSCIKTQSWISICALCGQCGHATGHEGRRCRFTWKKWCYQQLRAVAEIG